MLLKRPIALYTSKEVRIPPSCRPRIGIPWMAELLVSVRISSSTTLPEPESCQLIWFLTRSTFLSCRAPGSTMIPECRAVAVAVSRPDPFISILFLSSRSDAARPSSSDPSLAHPISSPGAQNNHTLKYGLLINQIPMKQNATPPSVL